MKANTVLFWILAVFCWVSSAVYTYWNVLDHGGWEPVGTLAMALAGVLSAFLAFYIGRVHTSQGGELPEDLLDSNIDDGDAELGFFSPWSWWPLMLGGSIALVMAGLAVGFWLAIFAIGFVFISLVGWTYEYYRGRFAR